MNKQIHIVSFDVPFPPDYGGVLDVYLRAKGLKNLGYSVILHCYEYGRGRNHDFSDIANEVYYYDRKNGVKSAFSNLPYIVKSRNSEMLLSRLLANGGPVLLEGQHCAFWVDELIKNQKQVAVRMHNIEWQYYRDLAKDAKTVSERLFFGLESRKLRKHENKLKKVPLLCISENDRDYYNQLGFQASYLPVTIDADLILEPAEGKTFVLFHGNLSVPENQEAIDAVIRENRRKKLEIPVVIAGKNPSAHLIKKIQSQGWECIANPNDSDLNELMRSCSVHLLIGFKTSGIKLKVIRALLSGKPCIATRELLGIPVLEKHCEVWDPVLPLADKIDLVLKLSHRPAYRLEELETEFGLEKLKSALQEIGFL
ncbi:MAG: putative mannosyltransferase [Fluviicola sp.]|jgi:hypothetical protein|uniref:glycosyltransferase n=1 Tax=Fluviicola sp. TaxID=1917219 RepID=UPI002621CED3|nr:glycosyltransferase [Fluviicola sp.]MDF3029276.1 putative mannosyltransferase [Fluviicola sp.]